MACASFGERAVLVLGERPDLVAGLHLRKKSRKRSHLNHTLSGMYMDVEDRKSKTRNLGALLLSVGGPSVGIHNYLRIPVEMSGFGILVDCLGRVVTVASKSLA